MPYTHAARITATAHAIRTTAIDDATFGAVWAAALRTGPVPPPAEAPNHSNALQGNLAEFLAWDLGERFWSEFQRRHTRTANATAPWSAHSRSGIDIFVLVPGIPPQLLIVEVKSSLSDGVPQINGAASSLQTDFRHLFEGSVQTRLMLAIGDFMATALYGDDPQSAHAIRDCVGKSPAECRNIRLLGVLVCSNGDQEADFVARRDTAFNDLRGWLISQGWPFEAIKMRTIECTSLRIVFDAVLAQACI